jgi:glycosyltransferase involved in cell wall biosynthesis
MDSSIDRNYKILVIAPVFYPEVGGYSHALTNFSRFLASKGNLIHVLTFTTQLEGRKEIEDKNIKVYRLKRFKILKGINLFLNEYRMANLINKLDKKNDYDFIFFETAELPLTLFFCLTFFKKKYKTGVRIHATTETEVTVFRKKGLYEKIRYFFLEKAIKKIYVIFSTNSYHLNFVNKYYLKENAYLICGKIEAVIPNIIYGSEKKELADNNFNFDFLDENRITFLTVGRMNYDGIIQKGFQDILFALFFLKNRDYFQNLKLIIVGDGEMREKLIRLSKKLGLENQVMFIKSLPNEKIQFLQSKVSAVILASRFEGCSMFALESLKNGAPLIFSNVGGIKEMVKPRFNGLLFEPNNFFDLSKKIDYFIKHLLPKIDKIRKNSIKFYKKKFDSEKTYRKFKHFLDVMIASKNFKL